MDTNRDHVPTDPGFWSEMFYMVENLWLESDSFNSRVEHGPVWTDCGHLVEERERAATCMVSVTPPATRRPHAAHPSPPTPLHRPNPPAR